MWWATAVDHFKPGILGWVLGDHSAKTFKPLWELVEQWRCYFYVTDGWKVYPMFIPDGDEIIGKTYMTRVGAIRWIVNHGESPYITFPATRLNFRSDKSASPFCQTQVWLPICPHRRPLDSWRVKPEGTIRHLMRDDTGEERGIPMVKLSLEK